MPARYVLLVLVVVALEGREMDHCGCLDVRVDNLVMPFPLKSLLRLKSPNGGERQEKKD